MQDKHNQFPDGFLWGASTSSHQVEGGNRNDWTRWEASNAHQLAKSASKKWRKISPIWDDIKEAATDPANYLSGEACDHWNRYEEDFDLVKEIGLNAYRFSIEWSRVEPEPGKYDQEALRHYARMVKALRARGIEPFVTLWHWTIPIWLADKGGWSNPEVTHHFVAYAAQVVKHLGADVRYWITLNEPNVYTNMSYLKGAWPPQIRSLWAYNQANRNLTKAHREVYHIIHAADDNALVGIAHNFIPYFAYRRRKINQLFKRFFDLHWNLSFIMGAREHMDFIGVNHYFQYVVNFGWNKPIGNKRSDLGWELYPQAMFHILDSLKKYNLPIYITENGLADSKDQFRAWFIEETLRNVYSAIHNGADVRGYFHWSLLDNFEWDKGFWPRFGLIEVDFTTQGRRVRQSARTYSRIISEGGVSQPASH